MDLIDKQGSESDESNCPTPTSHGVSSKAPNLKTCVDCGTSKTPLWRGGPAGPKSLCNACGIKSRKKRSAHQGIAKDEKKMNKKAKKSTAVIKQGNGNSQSSSNSSTICSEDSTTSNCSIGEKKTLWCSAFGGDASLQRPRSNSKRRSRKLKEEEQAALLLMAMSCGTVYS